MQSIKLRNVCVCVCVPSYVYLMYEIVYVILIYKGGQVRGNNQPS